jgi:hypothetical protein
MTVAVDLELTLRPAGTSYHAEARCLPPGSDAPIDATATVQIEPARLLALTADPAAYGLALGRMVLVQAISRAVDQARVAAQRANVPLRLRLVVPPELHLVRWETLRDPAHPDAPLLTTGGQILFSRYLSSSDWTPVQPRPLGRRRALVLLASPSDLADYGLAPFDVAAERALIEQSLAPLPTTVLGAGQATLGALVEALRSGPDILYLMAHGRVDEAGETLLYLESTDGKTAPVRGSEVARRVAEQAVRPQLIVLGSCESAGDGHGEALLTLGPLLARAGVSAVLAMQGRVTLHTLRTFLSACLRALTEDGRVDAAVSHARGLVRDRADFWAPVLFLRLQSGRLWADSQSAQEASKTTLHTLQNFGSSAPLVMQVGPLSPRQRSELLARVALNCHERLTNALAYQVWLQLGLHTRPDAVDPSWRRMHLLVSDEARPVPPGTPLLELFDDLTGQLLVLGAPGAGKTILLVELAQALTERAQQDAQARIPVLLNVAAWRSGQSLRDWLKATLPDALGASKGFASQLAASDELILMLDGLDEVAESHRPACVAAINTYLNERDVAPPLIVGCRSREYAEIGARLQIIGAIELEPLELVVVERALVSVPAAQGVLTALQTDVLLRELASTPLMVNVMLLAHGGQDVPLVQSQSLEERRAVLWRAYVRRMLVQRGLVRWSRVQVLRWLRWLACLLREQNETNFLIDDLQPNVLSPVQWWWYRGINGLACGLTVALVYSLVFLFFQGPVFWLVFGPAIPLVQGLVWVLVQALHNGAFYGLVYGLIYGLSSRLIYGPSRLIYGLSSRLVYGLSSRLIVGLIYGLSVGLFYWLVDGVNEKLFYWLRDGRFYEIGIGLTLGMFAWLVGVWVSRTVERREQQHWSWVAWWRGLRENIVYGLSIGLGVGLLQVPLIGLPFGVGSGLSQGWIVSDVSVRRSPMQGLHASVKNGLTSGLILGLGAGLSCEVYRLLSGLADELSYELVFGLVFGLVGGLGIGLIDGLLNAFTQHHILRFVLSRSGHFPFRAVTFLDDMSAHLLLGRDGAFYRFRHLLLRDFIADLSDAELAALANSVKRGGAS